MLTYLADDMQLRTLTFWSLGRRHLGYAVERIKRRLHDWGLTKLAKKEREESIEEMEHADTIIARIIFLGGHPNLQTLNSLHIGENVQEILEADLAGEYDARTIAISGLIRSLTSD